NLQLTRPATRDEVNAFLRQTSLTAPLRHQIEYSENPDAASADFVGTNRAGIVDGLATIAAAHENDILYVWYHPDSRYTGQVRRLLERMAGVHPAILPRREPVRIEDVAAGVVAPGAQPALA